MIATLRKSYGQFITSGAQLVLIIIGLQTESREGWVACLILIAVISLFAWMSTMRRRRAITDTPTSRIGSAAQGYVELLGDGKPLDFPPLLSHLTHLPCLWYRFQVEEKSSTKDKWETVSQGESEVPFIIDDGSGRCVVDVEGAEILTRHKETWTVGKYRNTEWKKDQASLLKRFDLNGDGTIDMQEWGLARQAARREVARMHRDARNESDVHTLSCPRNGRHYLLSNIDPNKLARRYLLWAGFHVTVFLAALGAIPWVLQHPF